MTTIEVPRGHLRSALTAVLPHAGRETEETPNLGRVRLVADAGALLVWATDHRTSAFARVEGPEYTEAELPSWDMPADAVKKVLQVFKGPSDADARQMWADEPMKIHVGTSRVTFTEVGAILDGQSLTVGRIVPAGEDRYPDVPRELLTLSGAILDAPTTTARLNLEALARFVPAAKAYAGGVTALANLVPGHGLHRALVRLGHAFLGSVPAYPDASHDTAAVDESSHEQHAWWVDILKPQMRPLPIEVPGDVVDDLRAQAEAIFRTEEGGTARVTLHVVRDGAPR
ncbi:hypothetical protein [Actinotalea sp. JY-7876]|uniref:hypothetical protein n=1 Tax=Actinotalea sp. JY-7876 TaxID=2758442 RepID=UPI0015F7496B|nr:hypothetical protein [Actinotalea sp. JY-7876]